MTATLPMPAKLQKRRAKGLRVLRTNGWFHKLQVYASLVITPVALLYSLWRGIQNSDLFSTVLAIIGLIATVLVTRRFFVQRQELDKPPEKNPVLVRAEVLDTELVPHIKLLMQDEAKSLGVNLDTLSVYVIPKDGSANPRVIGNKEHMSLYVPEGFLKLLSNRGEQARAKALLEHEVAHAEQQDSDFWTLATVYQNVQMRVMLPIMAVQLVLFIGFAMYHVNSLNSASDRLNAEAEAVKKMNDQQYQKALQAIPQERPSGFSAGSASDAPAIQKIMADLNRDMNSMLIDAKTDQQQRTLQDAWMQIIVSSILGGVFPILALLNGFGSIRWFRRLSEQMADLAVVMHSNGQALYEGLDKYGEKNRGMQLFPTHPSTEWRLNRIRADLIMIETARRDVRFSGG